MENCKSIQYLFGEALSDELDDKQRQMFNGHLDHCKHCRAEYRTFKDTMHIMEKRKRPEVEEAFWDNYWDNLSEKAFPDKTHILGRIRPALTLIFSDHRKFALPAAAVLLILFGIFLGKLLFSPDRMPLFPKNETMVAQETDRSNSRYYTMVNNHMDNLKPIFAEYANYQDSNESDADFMPVRKELLKKLLLQNYLLKRVADKKKDPQLKNLIEDLQLILMEMINDSSEKTEKIRSVKDILEGNDVLFKMDMLKSENRFHKKGKKGEII